MRVVTLLPAATEIVAALGGAGDLVGISHECDFPPGLDHLPRVTATPLDPSAPSGAIDAEVRRLRDAGRPVITVEAAALRRLAPDLVITQGLCEVCAVADGEVHRLAAAVDPSPAVLSLGATTLDGIARDITEVGRALARSEAAASLVRRMTTCLGELRHRAPRNRRPRVLCIEWLEPLYLAGHWVPELVEAAGGLDAGAVPGSHSARRTWSEVAALSADLIAVMLCGFGVDRALRELDAVESIEARALLSAPPVWVLDGNAYTSRAGPRVVEGARCLQAALEGREETGATRWAPSWTS
jgi:iron complex transport system substrate-binding protein